MYIQSDDSIQHFIDRPITLRCPQCSVLAAMIAVSVPKHQLIHRFGLDEVGITYRCSSCNGPVFLKYGVNRNSNPIQLSSEFENISRSLEPFEMKYLEGDVAADFNEALVCYSSGCWNAFAAMCRRCIQSVSSNLGADGTSKVQHQLNDLKAIGITDEQTFSQLETIVLSGHDGAHPHLPALGAERAVVLMQIMKDTLYQLYVRPAKIREASDLRQTAIEQRNNEG